MARIIVCRHGNTFDKGDTVTRVGGRTDLPLSISGKAQATALAAHFAGTPFTAAYCSALQRTRETAQAILDACNGSPDLEELPFLREVDYGPDENQPEEEVVARLGEAAIRAWDEDGKVPDGWKVDVAGIRDGWRRLITRASNMPEDAIILVVTSNGVARFLPGVVKDKPADLDRKLKTGAWGEVIVDGGQSRIVSWNQRPA
ncbi:MAG: histidine phosphatase family protein [Hyphomonas sp.]|uniref:histidine phosphatase family protein n=1 Tax=Hyphomonas sp. TaxID=87 RepID=UPI003527D70E